MTGARSVEDPVAAEERLAETARRLAGLVPGAERSRAFPREAVELFAARGHLAERWDGGPLGRITESVRVAEAFGRQGLGGLGVGISIQSEAVLAVLTRHGARRPDLGALRDDVLAGRRIGCVAISEVAHGSDIAAVDATVLRRQGDRWSLQGRKQYVSLGEVADFALVLAREERTGPTMVLVPRSGFTVLERHRTSGMRSLGTVAAGIDADLDDDAVIGRCGGGLIEATWALSHERLAAAAQALGTARLALALAVSHAGRRRQFGKLLHAHQAVRLRLADLSAHLDLARRGLRGLAAEAMETGHFPMREVAGAKVTCARLAEHVVSEARHVFGGLGYVEDATPLDRLARDIRLARLGGGTDEMMLELVGAALTPDDEAYDRMVAAP